MKRKDFLKNALMGIAVSLLPKILQPVEYELECGPITKLPIRERNLWIINDGRVGYLAFDENKKIQFIAHKPL